MRLRVVALKRLKPLTGNWFPRCGALQQLQEAGVWKEYGREYQNSIPEHPIRCKMFKQISIVASFEEGNVSKTMHDVRKHIQRTGHKGRKHIDQHLAWIAIEVARRLNSKAVPTFKGIL